MDTILGQTGKIVQPPLTMDRPTATALHNKYRSESTHDRRSLEQALTREGVHRVIQPEGLGRHPADKGDATSIKPADVSHMSANEAHIERPSPKASPLAKSKASSGSRNLDHHHGRGQAHDPSSDEFLFLEVGPQGGDDAPDPPAVSESPPAAEGNIYERAYHEEVERIRSQSTGATLYLTRRVEKPDGHEGDSRMVDAEPPPGHKHEGAGGRLSRVIDMARELAGSSSHH